MKAFIKPLFILAILGLAFSKSFGQDINQVVKVTNLKKVKGTLYIGWYNKSADFPVNDRAIFREEIEVSDLSEVTVQFDNIPAGKYAIAIFLDENDNYKLDRNLFGIPKEKYGFSNNVLPALRAATFEESVFSLTDDKRSTIVINLK